MALTPAPMMILSMCLAQVKGEVEAGISYLLRKRESDQYRHFMPRTLFEAASGGKQAPTFPLS